MRTSDSTRNWTTDCKLLHFSHIPHPFLWKLTKMAVCEDARWMPHHQRMGADNILAASQARQPCSACLQRFNVNNTFNAKELIEKNKYFTFLERDVVFYREYKNNRVTYRAPTRGQKIGSGCNDRCSDDPLRYAGILGQITSSLDSPGIQHEGKIKNIQDLYIFPRSK